MSSDSFEFESGEPISDEVLVHDFIHAPVLAEERCLLLLKQDDVDKRRQKRFEERVVRPIPPGARGKIFIL
jgi:hypothetical protein